VLSRKATLADGRAVDVCVEGERRSAVCESGEFGDAVGKTVRVDRTG
jgi:hypothetical protein